MAIFARLKHAWNAFTNQDQVRDELGPIAAYSGGVSYGRRPDQNRLRYTNERTILASILTRLGIDVASVDIRHVRLDDSERYLEDMKSGLNECLKVAANIDQEARAFRQDVAMSLFDQGCIAIVPVDTTLNPSVSGGFDIQTMRVGKICQWMADRVVVEVYNERKGIREMLNLEKKFVAIIENPLYSVMNEPNSTLQRIIVKLNQMDTVDDQIASGKLDLIIQLPYVVKTEARRQQAMQRRTDIEFQLKGSQYGIAYTDGTEKITQLNRPAENQMLKEIEYLIDMLYTQLGLTPEVMNGTASQEAMLNYYYRSIDPVLGAITEAMHRKFLTKTARSQGQAIMYFRDPFRLVPVEQVAQIADVFTRNEIASSNEIRQAIGWKPSKDPKADQLVNSNMPQPADAAAPAPAADGGVDPATQASLDEMGAQIDQMFQQLGVDENALG